MTAGHSKSKIFLILSATILLLSACGKTAPTHFYILHPMTETGQATQTGMKDELAVAISPADMPEHLNRSQIVTRQDGHRVTIDEFHRWAEPLDAGFTNILAENLSLLLSTNRIATVNRLKYSPEYDYHIFVDILRFDGQVGGEASLICRWSILRKNEISASAVHRSQITRPVEGNSYQDLVVAMSRLIADLSREIADRILKLEGTS